MYRLYIKASKYQQPAHLDFGAIVTILISLALWGAVIVGIGWVLFGGWLSIG